MELAFMIDQVANEVTVQPVIDQLERFVVPFGIGHWNLM
jgi:hypothetical protein